MRILFIIFWFLSIWSAYAASLPNHAITITNGKFEPKEIEVPAGQRFKITVRNTGTSPVEFENLSLRVEKVLGLGIESFVVIHPLKPGIYHFIDEFHMEMGGFNIIAKEQ
ncbi:MAG: hypothetical protein JSC189_000349 [Candidatus Tokpelaia sp. JSC189]|nr:MAG: hypothetical protein JSC189_000349 [Candidatus Tokpelaia sp. JSC189]